VALQASWLQHLHSARGAVTHFGFLESRKEIGHLLVDFAVLDRSFDFAYRGDPSTAMAGSAANRPAVSGGCETNTLFHHTPLP
jgi:hypothetical protein